MEHENEKNKTTYQNESAIIDWKQYNKPRHNAVDYVIHGFHYRMCCNHTRYHDREKSQLYL